MLGGTLPASDAHAWRSSTSAVIDDAPHDEARMRSRDRADRSRTRVAITGPVAAVNAAAVRCDARRSIWHRCVEIIAPRQRYRCWPVPGRSPAAGTAARPAEGRRCALDGVHHRVPRVHRQPVLMTTTPAHPRPWSTWDRRPRPGPPRPRSPVRPRFTADRPAGSRRGRSAAPDRRAHPAQGRQLPLAQSSIGLTGDRQQFQLVTGAGARFRDSVVTPWRE